MRETGAIQQSTTTTTPAAWPDQGASGASMGPVQPHADGSAAQSSAVVADAAVTAAPGKSGGKLCRWYTGSNGKRYCIKLT